MGCNSGIESRSCDGVPARMVALALLLVMGSSTWTCSGALSVAAAPNFKVANHLRHGAALTVRHPPGCCSPCGPRGASPEIVCPAMCVQCDDVVVQAGRVAVLDEDVGPFPLPYLEIQVKEKVYCVEERDISLIKAWTTLAVGPGACGLYNDGLTAFVNIVRGAETHRVASLCLYVCNRD